MHDSKSECEFINKQNVEFLEIIAIEYQFLIEKFMKVDDVVDSQKYEINMICKEKTNHIEKI